MGRVLWGGQSVSHGPHVLRTAFARDFEPEQSLRLACIAMPCHLHGFRESKGFPEQVFTHGEQSLGSLLHATFCSTVRYMPPGFRNEIKLCGGWGIITLVLSRYLSWCMHAGPANVPGHMGMVAKRHTLYYLGCNYPEELFHYCTCTFWPIAAPGVLCCGY